MLDTTPLAITALLTLFAYLLGSISSAIVTCRLLGLPDPRSQGSRNPGATNVMRIGGKKPAAITLAGDMLKGLLPVLLAQLVTQEGWILALVGAAAFLGHLYPIFFGFVGGKGVATGFGVLFGWSYLAGALAVLTWLIVAKVFRISSIAALVAFLLAPAFLWWMTASAALAVTMAGITVLTYWRHRENIAKLMAGRESKIQP